MSIGWLATLIHPIYMTTGVIAGIAGLLGTGGCTLMMPVICPEFHY